MPAKFGAAVMRPASFVSSSVSSRCRSKALSLRPSSQYRFTLTTRSHASTLSIRRPLRLPRRQIFRVEPRTQISRHLSSDTKRWIGESFKGAARLTAYLWAIAFLTYVAWQGWEHDSQEKLSPTPADWSFWTRYYMREAQISQSPSQLSGLELPRWIEVVTAIKKVIERLEDSKLDGAEIRSALGEGEGHILVEGVGRTGLDISTCSETWRRGYHKALMTAGFAAEHVDGFVVDGKSGKVFPPQVVLGPSYPNPMPLPFDSNLEPPREENCVPFFVQPQIFYMRILTTTGFDNDQKLQAALAYGNWLDFKGLHSSASEMYDWALDITESAYIERGETPPYDRQTGTLRKDASFVSSNSLTTITAIAEHLAKAGDTQKALSAFLTALRVLRSLQSQDATAASRSPAPATSPTLDARVAQHPSPSSSSSSPSSFFSSPISYLSSLFVEYPYPPPPPSGDLPAARDVFSACAEAAVLSHIGEIIYVTPPSSLPRALLAAQAPSSKANAVQASPAQAAGLAWTRQAVDLAELSIRKLSGRQDDQVLVSGSPDQDSMMRVRPKKNFAKDGPKDKAERDAALGTCAQCLDVAVVNWQKMVSRLAESERNLQIERARLRRAKSSPPTVKEDDRLPQLPQTPTDANRGWFSWIWGLGTRSGTSSPATAGDDSDLGQWMNEARMVEERKFAARRLLREEKLPVKF